ncbi:hypothetical protein BCV70DRAFT_102675 [Testicularia cyperi]|uniref:Uncharacterized protein n=1 Tax=Testicularia cyperi TaxID=1882483 RepID=A0A317XP92_9BASI|nr:hypothetical protein BCV70DRAFT_102675 [Testicularia cyperi]
MTDQWPPTLTASIGAAPASFSAVQYIPFKYCNTVVLFLCRRRRHTVLALSVSFSLSFFSVGSGFMHGWLVQLFRRSSPARPRLIDMADLDRCYSILPLPDPSLPLSCLSHTPSTVSWALPFSLTRVSLLQAPAPSGPSLHLLLLDVQSSVTVSCIPRTGPSVPELKAALFVISRHCIRVSLTLPPLLFYLPLWYSILRYAPVGSRSPPGFGHRPPSNDS